MNGAFIAGFAFFVVMMAVIAFFALRWGVRRDRQVRAERAGPSESGPGPTATPGDDAGAGTADGPTQAGRAP